jgi:hypothetical protein
MRLESQLSRMNSQTFSCEFSSTFGWQRDDADVVGHNQPRREVPSGLIEQQHRMTARRDLGRDGRQVQVHRLGVAPGHDEACRLAFLETDGSEDVGRGSALVVRSRWSGSSLCPATGDLVLLTDALTTIIEAGISTCELGAVETAANLPAPVRSTQTGILLALAVMDAMIPGVITVWSIPVARHPRASPGDFIGPEEQMLFWSVKR